MFESTRNDIFPPLVSRYVFNSVWRALIRYAALLCRVCDEFSTALSSTIIQKIYRQFKNELKLSVEKITCQFIKNIPSFRRANFRSCLLEDFEMKYVITLVQASVKPEASDSFLIRSEPAFVLTF